MVVCAMTLDLFVTRGSVKSLVPVNVNARISSQLNNDRVDTTQGVDMTKKLIATELTNVINAHTTQNQPVLSMVKWYGSGTSALNKLVRNIEAAMFAAKTDFINPIF